MECGHSSIREWTKMRGKGHVPSLPEVSAKALCRFISKHHSHHCEAGEDPEQQEPESNPGKSKGGGGAWRAFCSDRFSGIKFTRENLRLAKREFAALTPEEYEHYKEVGHLMTLQARHRRMQTVNVQPGSRELAIPDSSSSILENPDSMLMIAGDDFTERFGSFKNIILQEQRAKRQAEKNAQVPEDPTDSAEQDPSLVELVASGGPGLLKGLRRNPNGSEEVSLAVDRFRWKLPVIPFVRAVLDFAARSEDELKVADLENAWAKLHELVQHEKLQKLEFANGKPFPVTPCFLTLQAMEGQDGIETRTSLDFLKIYWDMAQPCFARFYTIVDSKHIELEDDMMLPKYVDVKLEAIEPKCFWRGSTVELAPKNRKRKQTQDSGEGDLFVRKVAQRKPTQGSAASASKPGIDRNDVCDNLDTVGVGTTDMDASDYDIDRDPDFMPDVPPNSAFDPDLEAELGKLIEEMCPPEDEPDTKEEEADAGLLHDFFAAAMLEDASDDDGPEGFMTSDEAAAVASGHAPCSGGDAGSSSSSSSSTSSSSSDTSSASSTPKGNAKTKPAAKPQPKHRVVQTLQEAGGRSASAQDASTVYIGPLKLVKRFHPVPCHSNRY
eukprot:s658_g4.t1